MSIVKGNHAGLGGAGAPGGALAGGVYSYNIDQSLRFEDGDSPNLTRTLASDGNRKTWTWSGWVKRANITAAYRPFFSAGTSGTSWALMFGDDERLFIQSRSGSSNQFVQKTNNLFRDVSAWYHIVYAFDTTQATDTDRSKLYVNGEQLTLIQHTTNPIYPNLNTDYHVNNSSLTHYIGYGATHNGYLDGYLAEVNFVDGIALDASSFGETINGIWVPKETSGITYGNNGWYIPFIQDKTGGNSISFSTTSDRVQHTDATAYDIGASDDFTIEFFFKTSEVGSGAGHFMGNYATGGPHHLITYSFSGSTRDIYFYSNNGQALYWSVAGDVTLSNNTWHHMVFQRNGTVLRAYIDGTRLTTVANASSSWTLSDGKATNFNQSYDLAHIRLGNVYTTNPIIGSLSNVRYVIGNTVYADDDNDITVPTATLTAVTGTKLLTAINATLGDDISTENNDATISGSPTLSYDSPFTTSNFFDDASGNNNDFTANNLSINDVVPDSPTNNMAVLSSVNKYTNATSDDVREGGLEERGNSSGYAGTVTFDATDTDGYYYEVTHTGTPGGGCTHGMMNFTDSINQYGGVPGDSDRSGWWGVYRRGAGGGNTFWYYLDGVQTGDLGVAGSANDVWMYLIKDGKFYIGRNGTWFNSADPSAGTGHYASGLTGTDWTIFSGNGYNVTGGHKIRVDRNLWSYGDASYKEIKTSNIAEPTIGPNSTTTSDEHFNTVLYTGNASTNAITGVGFQADLLWAKRRNSVAHSNLIDSVRGVKKHLSSSSTNAEDTEGASNGLASFDADGFTWAGVNTGTGAVNSSGDSFVGWAWKAGGTAVSNTDGSITSSVSANQDAGFSIVSWTGNGTSGATVGHGLTSPEFSIVKNRDDATNWDVCWVDFSSGTSLNLDDTTAEFSPTQGYQTLGLSTITLNSGGSGVTRVNTNNQDYVAYVFKSVEGFSKVGSYVGNANADGTFVYTGFRPRWLMFKDLSNTNLAWNIYYDEASPYNVMNDYLQAASSAAESTNISTRNLDFLSNGFKLRDAYAQNYAASYLYICFASAPFKYANAR